MQLHIQHTTRYEYSVSSRYAVQRLRLTPRDSDSQHIQSWRIDAPGIESAPSYTDGFGNVVHLLAHMEPLETIEITAAGVVITSDTGGVVGKTDETANPAVFLRQTVLTESSPAIEKMANEARRSTGLAEPINVLHALQEAIADRVNYLTDETDAQTSAAQAFAAGNGVCQDHAHIFIAATRALGIPSRYVTGYLQVEGESAHAAHHAWAESHVPDLGWVGFDPANRICPTEHYVRLGCGSDAAMAAPVTGSRRGGGSERLFVDVNVLQSQQ